MSDLSPLFVFAGGGSGGHLAPGIAVAEELRRRIPACRIRFSGSARTVEDSMLAATGFERSVHAARPLTDLKRRPLRFLYSHWKGLRDERRAIRADRPAAVVGLGGFASVPLVFAATRANVPVLLLEQNAVPGRATWWLSRRHPVCLTFSEARVCLPESAVVHHTGNPLRRDIRQLGVQDLAPPEAPRTLLVLGGSQGSTQVNDSMLASVPRIGSSLLAGWRIVHQTGAIGANRVSAAYDSVGINAIVQPFFSDMAQRYAEASLVVSRAGATTLTELAVAGVPAILIPYPAAADNHQAHNAAVFAASGAARIIDSTNTREVVDLSAILMQLMTSDDDRARMRTAMRMHARPDAAVAVADLLLGLLR